MCSWKKYVLEVCTFAQCVLEKCVILNSLSPRMRYGERSDSERSVIVNSVSLRCVLLNSMRYGKQYVFERRVMVNSMSLRMRYSKRSVLVRSIMVNSVSLKDAVW